jgi:hypothetical protein
MGEILWGCEGWRREGRGGEGHLSAIWRLGGIDENFMWEILRVLSLGSGYARCCQEINYKRVSSSILLNTRTSKALIQRSLAHERDDPQHRRVQDVQVYERSTKDTLLRSRALWCIRSVNPRWKL